MGNFHPPLTHVRASASVCRWLPCGCTRAAGAALALTGIYWVGCMFTIRPEEQALERVFGEEYRRYRAAVPRYMRLPRFR